MKHAIILMLTVLTLNAQQHVTATLSLNHAELGCQSKGEIFPSNQMNIDFNIDTMPGGGVFVQWYHGGSWFILENSVRFTNPQLQPTFLGQNSYYNFQVDNWCDSLTQTGLFDADSMYRFMYVDIVTEQWHVIDTFYTYCPHSYSPMGMDEQNYNEEPIKVEWYNLSGQLIPEIYNSGIYIKVSTFSNGRQSRTKILINR